MPEKKINNCADNCNNLALHLVFMVAGAAAGWGWGGLLLASSVARSATQATVGTVYTCLYGGGMFYSNKNTANQVPGPEIQLRDYPNAFTPIPVVVLTRDEHGSTGPS